MFTRILKFTEEWWSGDIYVGNRSQTLECDLSFGTLLSISKRLNMESLDETQSQFWVLEDSDIELLDSVDNSGILEDDEVVS